MRNACLGLALVSLGCASAPDQPLGTNASAISGGSETGASYPYAVGLLSGGASLCSGALIAPNLVLTARHCVSTLNTGGQLTASSVFISNFRPAEIVVTTKSTIDGNGFRAREVLYPTSNKAKGNDIALIILNSNVPAAEAKPVTPAVQHALFNTKRYSTGMTAIGFGLTGAGNNDSGTRRIRSNLSIECMDGSTTPCSSIMDPSGEAPIDANEFISSGGVCSGDSGSSAYEAKSMAAGAPISMGVASRAPDTCDLAVYTRTDAHKALIIQAGKRAASLGGYTVPVWTQAVTPDPEDTPYVPPPKGALGAACTVSAECESKLCAKKPTGSGRVCSQTCSPDPDDCPDGFACGTGNQCFAGQKAVTEPAAEEPPAAETPPGETTASAESSGCSSAGSQSSPGFSLLAAALALSFTWKRKRT